MGKLYKIRRAIRRNPNDWMTFVVPTGLRHRLLASPDASGASFWGGEWRPFRALFRSHYPGPYEGFVRKVIAEIRAERDAGVGISDSGDNGPKE